MNKINSFQIFTDIFKLGTRSLLIVNVCGLNMQLNVNKLNRKIAGWLLMILKKVGIMVFHVLILCSKRIVLLLPMIRAGEFVNSSSSIRFWSKILSGGLIKSMMENSGISIIIVQIWSRHLEEWRESFSTHSLKAHISLLGKVCSGKRLQDSKNQWNSRSWLMLSDQVSIKFQTEDSPFGGLQQSIGQTYT